MNPRDFTKVTFKKTRSERSVICSSEYSGGWNGKYFSIVLRKWSRFAPQRRYWNNFSKIHQFYVLESAVMHDFYFSSVSILLITRITGISAFFSFLKPIHHFVSTCLHRVPTTWLHTQCKKEAALFVILLIARTSFVHT